MITIPKTYGDHAAVPRRGTLVNPNGEPADMRHPSDYPVTAECKDCDAPVRLSSKSDMEWQHAPKGDQKPLPAGDVAP